MEIKKITDSKGEFVKRSYTFTDSNGNTVTRSYKLPETAIMGLEKELKHLIRHSADERIEKTMTDLIIEIANLKSEFGRLRFFGDPEIEYR